MKDTHPHALSVTIGGKEFTLKLGAKAFAIAAEQHGREISIQDLQHPTMNGLTTIGWLGFLPDNPTMKYMDFVELLEESGSYFQILEAIGEAFQTLMTGTSKTGGSGPKRKAHEGNAGKGKRA